MRRPLLPVKDTGVSSEPSPKRRSAVAIRNARNVLVLCRQPCGTIDITAGPPRIDPLEDVRDGPSEGPSPRFTRARARPPAPPWPVAASSPCCSPRAAWRDRPIRRRRRRSQPHGERAQPAPRSNEVRVGGAFLSRSRRVKSVQGRVTTSTVSAHLWSRLLALYVWEPSCGRIHGLPRWTLRPWTASAAIRSGSPQKA
jgi:hypothetical protein